MSKQSRRPNRRNRHERKGLVVVVHPDYHPTDDPGIDALIKRAAYFSIDTRVMSPNYAYLLPHDFEGDPADAALKLFWPPRDEYQEWIENARSLGLNGFVGSRTAEAIREARGVQ